MLRSCSLALWTMSAHARGGQDGSAIERVEDHLVEHAEAVGEPAGGSTEFDDLLRRPCPAAASAFLIGLPLAEVGDLACHVLEPHGMPDTP